MKRILPLIILSFCAVVALQAQPTPISKAATPPSPQQSPTKVMNPYGLTQADMQVLAHAREAAMKARPDLAKDAAQLAQKMRDFQHKLNQAILQADPNLAPVVARIENRPAPSMPPRPFTPSPASPPSSSVHK